MRFPESEKYKNLDENGLRKLLVESHKPISHLIQPNVAYRAVLTALSYLHAVDTEVMLNVEMEISSGLLTPRTPVIDQKIEGCIIQEK